MICIKHFTKQRLKTLERAVAPHDGAHYILVTLTSDDSAIVNIEAMKSNGEYDHAHDVDTVEAFNRFFEGKTVNSVVNLIAYDISDTVPNSLAREVMKCEI